MVQYSLTEHIFISEAVYSSHSRDMEVGKRGRRGGFRPLDLGTPAGGGRERSVEVVAALREMGFGYNRAVRAVLATGSEVR